MWYLHFASQDDVAAVISGLVGAAVVLILGVTQRKRGRQRILVTDYRRGVHFSNGAFKEVLPPGSHTFNPEHDQITIVDMRPQPIVIERQVFQDAMGAQAIISIGTELIVENPQLAATALRDQIKDAYVLVRDTLRAIMPTLVVSGMGENRASVKTALSQAIASELKKVGMGITDIEITELWAGIPVIHVGATTGVVQ